MKKRFRSKGAWLVLSMAGFGLASACTLASPFDRLVAGVIGPTAEVVMTARPTFTSTPVASPTPTQTSTPTVTPIPTDTPTPLPPTVTRTPRPTRTPTPTPDQHPGPAAAPYLYAWANGYPGPYLGLSIGRTL